ncbi:Zinc finger protein 701 [Plecturocebus cupreus]
MGFLHVGQAGLELPTSGDLPASASQSAGITDSSHQPWSTDHFLMLLSFTFLFYLGAAFPCSSSEPPKVAKCTAKPSSSGKDGGGENTEEVTNVGVALDVVQVPAAAP